MSQEPTKDEILNAAIENAVMSAFSIGYDARSDGNYSRSDAVQVAMNLQSTVSLALEAEANRPNISAKRYELTFDKNTKVCTPREKPDGRFMLAEEVLENRPKVSIDQTRKTPSTERAISNFRNFIAPDMKLPESWEQQLRVEINTAIEAERNQRVSVSREAVRKLVYQVRTFYYTDKDGGLTVDEATDAIMELLEGRAQCTSSLK